MSAFRQYDPGSPDGGEIWYPKGMGGAPLPLFPPLLPAEPFPTDALGPVLSRAAHAIARKVQVPPAMAAQSVLAAAALAAQSHADVRLPYGQVRPLSLFFVTVAASGDRKSSADNEALWPVAKREKALREEFDAAVKWKPEHAAWTAEHKKIEANKNLSMSERKDALVMIGDEPEKPLAPFLVTGDLTIDGLTKNWINAHPGLGIFTAEAGVFTNGHGMSDDNRLRTAAMLSEVWDGKPVKRVRALDGVTILPGRRLSMHLMVQPGAAAGFLGNSVMRDQGLLSRVLVSAPPSLAGTRLHREVEPADDAAIRCYGARILSLLEHPGALAEGKRNELDPPALVIDDESAVALSAFADHVEVQVGSAEGLKPIGDFAAKAAEHAARIAGVLAIVADRMAAIITMKAMGGALALADWYVTETLRLHQAGRRDPKLLQAHGLLEWMQKRPEREILFRDVLQLGPADTRTKAAAEASLDVLKAHGWIEDASIRPRSFRLITGGV